MSWTIRALDPHDADQRPLFDQWAAARAAAQVGDMGEFASPYSAEEIISFADEPGVLRKYYAALVAGLVVGTLVVVQPQRDDHPTAFMSVHVDPDYQRQGIGSDLLAHGEQLAWAAGYTSVAGETGWLPDHADVSGAILGRRGYEPALTTIQNELYLTGDRPDRSRVDPAYEIATCAGMPPAEWLDGLAHLMARMSTDAPWGDLDLREEVWDAARYAESVQTTLDAGRTVTTAVARHRGTGEFVAFSVCVVSAATPDFAFQHETLVLTEHRGHGLGIAVKEALVDRLGADQPGVAMVRTWNARTNVAMLAVNRRLGYVPVAFECDWQKRRPEDQSSSR